MDMIIKPSRIGWTWGFKMLTISFLLIRGSQVYGSWMLMNWKSSYIFMMYTNHMKIEMHWHVMWLSSWMVHRSHRTSLLPCDYPLCSCEMAQLISSMNPMYGSWMADLVKFELSFFNGFCEHYYGIFTCKSWDNNPYNYWKISDTYYDSYYTPELK